MPDPETELRSDALRVEAEARELQRRVRPVARKAGAVVLGLALFGLLLRAVAAAICYALVARLWYGAYPPLGRIVVIGLVIAAIIASLERLRARRR